MDLGLSQRRSALGATLRYDLPRSLPDWTLSEEPMPESVLHDTIIDLLKLLLLAWTARTGRDALVARNLALRWDGLKPAVGTDPDLCVLEPRPPEAKLLKSLCTWLPGHAPPLCAIEVVSDAQPRKDYEAAPEKHAAAGTGELWIYDPLLVGPRSRGGPQRLQLWRRLESGEFARVYAGEGPVFSPAVSGWLHVVSEGLRLRLADDEAGTRWWMTPEEAARAAEEAERAAKEAERAAKEAERAARERALARVAELEAELRRRGA